MNLAHIASELYRLAKQAEDVAQLLEDIGHEGSAHFIAGVASMVRKLSDELR